MPGASHLTAHDGGCMYNMQYYCVALMDSSARKTCADSEEGRHLDGALNSALVLYSDAVDLGSTGPECEGGPLRVYIASPTEIL